MGMHVWVTGLCLGLAGFLLGASCGEDEASEPASAVVERDAHGHAKAAHAGAEAQTVEAPGKSAHEPSAQVQDQDTSKGIEGGTNGSKITIKRAGQAERDAYDEARERAKSQ